MNTNVSKKILVFDDEQIVGDIACQMFAFFKCEAIHVTGAQGAVDLYREEHSKKNCFDAVIMDLNVPGGDGGKEAVREVLAIDPDAKVFVSSGDPTDPAMVTPSDFGFVGALAKPFDLNAIKNFIAQLG